MTQDERWNNRYDEVVWFIETRRQCGQVSVSRERA